MNPPGGSGKVPAAPAAPLSKRPVDVTEFANRLWRVNRTSGRHVLAWNRLRHFGPLATMRWDPHPPPPADGQAAGVMYTATDVATAVAEVFQTTRVIDTSTDGPVLLAWTPIRPLALLVSHRQLAHPQRCRPTTDVRTEGYGPGLGTGDLRPVG